MALGWFRRRSGAETVEALYARIGEASREPGLYLALGVPDTVEGRLESLMLHAHLVLRRLKALPAPADQVAQDLVDQLFRHIDHGLRELGVGDVSVPKRMKKIAQNFYGRVQAYDVALDAGDRAALEAALERNIPGVAASPLAAWVEATGAHLATLELDAILGSARLFAPVPEGSA